MKQTFECDCCSHLLPIDDDKVFIGTCPECETKYGNMCYECNNEFEFDELTTVENHFICDGCREEQEMKPKLKTLKIVGFAERDHYRPLAERFYKDGRVADTYITGEDVWEHFQDYYDTETLARVIDAGMEESWLLCRHEATDELKEDTRGWVGEMIWSIDGLDGVFHTTYNTSSPFAMWLCGMEWCECPEWCDE